MNWLRSILHWFANLFRRTQVAITHGVYVYCGFASPRPEWGKVPGIQCPTQWPWKLQTKDRVPALGEYDERNPDVTKWRLQQMQRGKIDYACYQVEWRHDSYELLNSHCADNHPADSPTKFCLSFWDVLNSGSSDSYLPTLLPAQVSMSWAAFAGTIARKYMQQPNYLRVDGRPVLFIGAAQNLRSYQKQDHSPSDILSIVSASVLNVTGKKPYLIATGTTKDVRASLKSWGFDAFTEYLLYSDSWENAAATYRQWWSEAIRDAKTYGLEYWVPACVGYDPRAWGETTTPFMPTPAQFMEHLKEARALARENAKITRGQVIVYALNELGEGGILEPMLPGMLHDGDEMLRAHLAAITDDR